MSKKIIAITLGLMVLSACGKEDAAADAEADGKTVVYKSDFTGSFVSKMSTLVTTTGDSTGFASYVAGFIVMQASQDVTCPVVSATWDTPLTLPSATADFDVTIKYSLRENHPEGVTTKVRVNSREWTLEDVDGKTTTQTFTTSPGATGKMDTFVISSSPCSADNFHSTQMVVQGITISQ